MSDNKHIIKALYPLIRANAEKLVKLLLENVELNEEDYKKLFKYSLNVKSPLYKYFMKYYNGSLKSMGIFNLNEEWIMDILKSRNLKQGEIKYLLLYLTIPGQKEIKLNAIKYLAGLYEDPEWVAEKIFHMSDTIPDDVFKFLNDFIKDNKIDRTRLYFTNCYIPESEEEVKTQLSKIDIKKYHTLGRKVLEKYPVVIVDNIKERINEITWNSAVKLIKKIRNTYEYNKTEVMELFTKKFPFIDEEYRNRRFPIHRQLDLPPIDQLPSSKKLVSPF